MKRKCYLILSTVALNVFLGAPLYITDDILSTAERPSNEDDYIYRRSFFEVRDV